MPSEENAIGFLAHPSDGPHPGVVMIPDVFGLADHTRDIATRLAGEGFAVLAVDPYRLCGGVGAFDGPAAALRFIEGLSDPLILDTLQQGIDFLAAHKAARGQRIGVTGFCMGGQYALLGASACTGLSACAPFYGMLRYPEGLDPVRKPRSPLDALPDLRCPVLGFYGAEDEIIPVSDVQALRRGLARTPHKGEVRLYPGAGHAFMNDTRPQLYRKAAALDAFALLHTFLHAELG